ncbi:MAG: HYR domain-containing protein, partial [Candidatus Omnitrophica bacterium]|nr:HYR domain-containing protein [Candidatus Omnitrophota bacterium]
LGSATITAASVDEGSTDNCGIASIVVSTTTFTCADVGIHEVTLTVTDLSGNIAQCTSTVEVLDLIPPTIEAPSLDSIIADMSGNAILPDYIAGVVATDNCESASPLVVVQSPIPGATLGVGNTTVTFMTADSSGNIGEATAILTVFDSSVTLTPTPTFTQTPSDSETPTVTPTTDYDVAPDPADGVINVLDLLEWYGRIEEGSPTEILFDFSRFWQ